MVAMWLRACCHTASAALYRCVPTAVFHGLQLLPGPARHQAMAHIAALTAVAFGPAWLAGSAGNNADGQLGGGTTATQNLPTFVSGSHSFAQISAGNTHTCGVHTNGTALCWGK